jgi:arginase family enzyme
MPALEHIAGHSRFPHSITVHTENRHLRDALKFRIALIGVPEGRNSQSIGTSKAPDSIREELYRLSRIPGKSKIIDLGNMKQGVTFNDTIAGLTDILTNLIGENVFPLIIGGNSALTMAIDRAMSELKLNYTLAAIDSRIDFSTAKKESDPLNFLNTILAGHRSTMNHYINIGFQTYLNDPQVINRFLKRGSELVRIGDVRRAIYLTEPLLRDSDAAIFDISSIRQADAPGTLHPSPNGFYGEEICLLSRYAGISDNLKVFGLFDVNPEFDIRNQTSSLAAQIIWFFLEGFAQKQFEASSINKVKSGRFMWYHVRVTDLDDDLVFVKSNLTDRWWMEIRGESDKVNYIACSHEDYLKANQNEVPERWIKGSERFS